MTQRALARLIFTTSRLAEFCSEKELVNQTGHYSDDWPLVILKELVDNGLDACEEAGIAPIIKIEVSDTGIAISDDAPRAARLIAAQRAARKATPSRQSWPWDSPSTARAARPSSKAAASRIGSRFRSIRSGKSLGSPASAKPL